MSHENMEFFTVLEFANKLKIGPRSVIRSIKQGKIYAIRPSPGKNAPYRIPESELDRLQIQSMCEKKEE